MTRPRTKSDALLALLSDAAKAGAPCPANDELAVQIGGSLSTPGTLIHMLALRGVIVRESHARRRRITIVASGARTDWSLQCGNNHDRITRITALESRVALPKRAGLPGMGAADLEARVEADQAAQEKRRARLRMPSHGAKIALAGANGDSVARRSDLPPPPPYTPHDLVTDAAAIEAALRRSYFPLWLVVRDHGAASRRGFVHALADLASMGAMVFAENKFEGADNGGE